MYGVPSCYSITLTLTEAIVRDDVLIEKLLDDIKLRYFPTFDFQGEDVMDSLPDKFIETVFRWYSGFNEFNSDIIKRKEAGVLESIQYYRIFGFTSAIY